MPKRTDNEIKNYWNTHLKKLLIDKGIDPVTHKPLAYDSNPDEQSQSGSISPKSLPPSSSKNVPEITSSDETPKYDASLSSKKRCFKRSSSTSKLLNKVAARASSMGTILGASIEGTLISSTPLSSCLNDDFSETSQFQMEEFDPFYQSSEHIIDHMKEDISINNSEYDFSQFLEQFSNNEGEEADNTGGGYNQDLLMSDVSSTSVDEDEMMQNITGWSNYLLDHSDFNYDTSQDYDDKNFI